MLSPADTFAPRDLSDFEAKAFHRLQERCSIRRPISAPDGSGGTVDTLTEILTAPCALTRMLPPREVVSGQGVAGMSDWRLLLPLGTDIGPADEVLPWWLWTVTLGAPTAGTFTLTFRALTTAPIAYNATAATLLTRLEALASVGVGNVRLWGYSGGPWTVRLVGRRADNEAAITANFTGLTAAAATIERPVLNVLGVEDVATDAPQMTAWLTRRR